MRRLAEWTYQKFILLSKFVILAYCIFRLVVFARQQSGSDLEVALKSSFVIGLLLFGLLAIRQCFILLVSELVPFTIDGDRLLEDYKLQLLRQLEDDTEVIILRPKSRFGHTITLSATKNHSVPIISTSDDQLLRRLPSMEWSISTTSRAAPKALCYVVRINNQRYYLSENQTIDLFCYIMVDYGGIRDAEEVDDEIDKYCSGLGLVRNPG